MSSAQHSSVAVAIAIPIPIPAIVGKDANSDDEEIDPFLMILPHSEGPNPPPAPSSSVAAVDLESDDLIHPHHIPSINATLSIRLLPSLGISFQLWPAASTLVSLLSDLPLTAGILPSATPRRLRILELGSGTGLVGIAAAAVLGADVTITDLGLPLPNLRFNAAANAAVVAASGGRAEAAELGWGIEEQMETIGRDFDLILGSDIVYHDHLYEPLLETLKYLLGGDRDLVFIMAHLKRWKKESTFFNKARKMFAVDIVHRENPADGKRLGVLVYRFLPKRRRLL